MFMKNVSKVQQYVEAGLSAYKKYGGSYLQKMNPTIAAAAAVTIADSSKYELRKLLSKHTNWDDSLQAVVLQGTRIPVMDANKVFSTTMEMLSTVMDNPFNSNPKLTTHEASSIASWVANGLSGTADRIELFAADKFPGAFNRNAKRNRVLRKILVALDCWDDSTGSICQQRYAFISDSLSARKTDFKLFLSINPAHIITMSNPKHDSRGVMLTSCHSLNCDDYGYSAGCTGYASDDISMIAFTTKDNQTDADSCCTRKTSRQMLFYQPGSGILLQSRLYDTEGGTCGRSECGDLYRKMVQDAIAECEGCTNLWQTCSYSHQKDGWDIYFETGRGFGGYADWQYSEFAPMLSVVQGTKPEGFFKIGTSGFCLHCGEHEDGEFGIYCWHCKEEDICSECGKTDHRGNMYRAIDAQGQSVMVCDNCLEEYYEVCSDCGQWHHQERMHRTAYDSWLCEECYDYNIDSDKYSICPECGKLYRTTDIICYRGGRACVNCMAQNRAN